MILVHPTPHDMTLEQSLANVVSGGGQAAELREYIHDFVFSS